MVIATSPDEIGSIFVIHKHFGHDSQEMKVQALNRRGVHNGNTASIPLMSSFSAWMARGAPRFDLSVSNFRESLRRTGGGGAATVN